MAPAPEKEKAAQTNKIELSKNKSFTGDEEEEPTVSQIISEKIGRNTACTCGSGKKYKKCCGKS